MNSTRTPDPYPNRPAASRPTGRRPHPAARARRIAAVAALSATLTLAGLFAFTRSSSTTTTTEAAVAATSGSTSSGTSSSVGTSSSNTSSTAATAAATSTNAATSSHGS